MHMQHRAVARGQHRPLLRQLDNLKLRLELGHHPHWRLSVSHHVALAQLRLRDPIHLQNNILATAGELHLLILDENSCHRALVSNGLNNDFHARPDSALLDLTDCHRGTHILEPIKHRYPQRQILAALGRLDGIQPIQQGLASEPIWCLLPLLDVIASEAAHGKEEHLVVLETGLLQKRRQLLLDFIVPRLFPLDAGVVHLVDGDNQLVNPQRLRKQGVLPGLTASLEACLELALSRRYDQDTDVSLRGTTDHVGHVGFVPRRIEHCETPIWGFEVGSANLHGLTFCLLLFAGVHDVGEEPTLSVLVLGLLHILLNRPLIHTAAQVQDVATSSGLARINVANEDHVQVWPRIRLFQLTLFRLDWCRLFLLLLLLLHGLLNRRRFLLGCRLRSCRLRGLSRRGRLLHGLGLLHRGRCRLLCRLGWLRLVGLILPIPLLRSGRGCGFCLGFLLGGLLFLRFRLALQDLWRDNGLWCCGFRRLPGGLRSLVLLVRHFALGLGFGSLLLLLLLLLLLRGLFGLPLLEGHASTSTTAATTTATATAATAGALATSPPSTASTGTTLASSSEASLGTLAPRVRRLLLLWWLLLLLRLRLLLLLTKALVELLLLLELLLLRLRKLLLLAVAPAALLLGEALLTKALLRETLLPVAPISLLLLLLSVAPASLLVRIVALLVSITVAVVWLHRVERRAGGAKLGLGSGT
mmetsp:Transcript_23624/g.58923  ORF Transcript_23624/g.58923 Transcript_23624/m.58923 type:complete len:700 (+) Transcript_23624:341-2440(+)